MGAKPFAWCKLHFEVITAARFHSKCKKAAGGAYCHELTFKIPDWKKEQCKGVARHTRTRQRKRVVEMVPTD